MDSAAIFGKELKRDPAVAISTPRGAKSISLGPEHKVQFVIEFVGQRSFPATTALPLLEAEWSQALGNPEIFAMAPADESWRKLDLSFDGSIDSLALAWDVVSDRGELTSQACAHLLQVAESFGTQIQRRALPLPPPADISRMAAGLNELKDNLDIGVELMLVPRGRDFPERDVWIAAAALGLEYSQDGFFEIKGPTAETPYLTLTPMGGMPSFSLGSVQSGVSHPGLMLGFSVPLSPDPAYSLDAALQSGNHLAQSLEGVLFNDADQILGPSAKADLKSNLLAAIRALSGVGIEPGSQSAIKLFG
jgi:hypothetical protein